MSLGGMTRGWCSACLCNDIDWRTVHGAEEAQKRRRKRNERVSTALFARAYRHRARCSNAPSRSEIIA